MTDSSEHLRSTLETKMDDEQFDKLITAIITAGYAAREKSNIYNAGKNFLRIKALLEKEGVIEQHEDGITIG